MGMVTERTDDMLFGSTHQFLDPGDGSTGWVMAMSNDVWSANYAYEGQTPWGPYSLLPSDTWVW